MKFGGTSVGSSNAIKQVIAIIQKSLSQYKIAVVCSAMSSVTNNLILAGTYAKAQNKDGYLDILKKLENIHLEVIHTLIPVMHQSSTIAKIKVLLNKLEDILEGISLLNEFSAKTSDLVLSFGEILSCCMVADIMQNNGINAEFIDARKYIKTDSKFGNAKVDFDLTNINLQNLVNKLIKEKKTPVITGFIASNINNETTTLGRGGSDYTASIIGAAICSEMVEIWTDVDGVMTADPRLVKTAFTIPELSYHEAVELSHFGAKIIYTPTLFPAITKNIPLLVKNTFNPDNNGTLVSNKVSTNDFLIKGISSLNNISMLVIEGVSLAGVPGVLNRIFSALSKNNISVILVTQASSEYSICLVIDKTHGSDAVNFINTEFVHEINAGQMDMVLLREDVSIISIVGAGMCKTIGISGKLYESLGRNGISIVAIAQGSSEFNISTVIENKHLSKAMNVIHEVFFNKNLNTSINIFMVGTGLIAKALLRQINETAEYLLKEKNLQLNLISVANSKKMLMNKDGISFKTWLDALTNSGTPMNLRSYIEEMKSLNLPNAVFVDCTSNQDVAFCYENILKASISVVTPNKLANSSSYKSYKNLRDLTAQHKIKFMYETNVGAGLPIINTLQNLLISGDEVIRIEGVLSGTLSYIFNSFKGDKKFSDIVKEAKEKGYTEPDPRDDLNGMDVARKILILAREAGAIIDLAEVKIDNLIPEECKNATSIEDFFIKLEKNNSYFDEKKFQAEKENKVLRYVAKYENKTVSINLIMVDRSNPLYSLSGSDNMISFTTNRYKDRPLVVQGPGAGAEVTASGVFANIIATSNHLVG